MRRFAAILSLIALSLACTPDSGEDAFLDELYRDLPFDMPRIALPAMPDRSVSLTDFGGVGEGEERSIPTLLPGPSANWNGSAAAGCRYPQVSG